MPKTLDFKEIIPKLRGFYSLRKRLPSFSEMQKLFDYSSKGGVAKLVSRLIEEDFLEQDRSGRLSPAARFGLGAKVLGSVQAGFPSPAEEELVHSISLDDFLIAKPEATYLVKVSGDSMKDAGILPGDLVVVEKGKLPKNKDVVIAQVDGQWTLKYYEKRDGKAVLLPANSKYPVLTPRNELIVAGVVVGCVRKY